MMFLLQQTDGRQISELATLENKAIELARISPTSA